MKKICAVLSLFILFACNELSASCTTGLVHLSPRANTISQNPVILLDFMERDFKVLPQLDKMSFYLVTDEGKKIKLCILEKNKGFKVWAQILFKPKRKLVLGQKYSFRVEGYKVTREVSKLFLSVNEKKWTVSKKKDKIIPQFTGSIDHKYVNILNSTVSTHYTEITFGFKDKEKKDGPEKNTYVYVEVIDAKGNNYYLLPFQNQIEIRDGMCGANFQLKQDTDYTFSLRLMDMSGNKSKERKKMSFKTGNLLDVSRG